VVVGEPEVELGIKVLMDRPHEVGADRLANAVGGNLLYREPLIVVDFGTATTFDVISAEGDYCGGVIAPGINLSLEALHGATAKLPRIAVERPAKVIGRDTLGAMQSGIYWGYVSLIEGVVTRIKAERGEAMRVVATGGLAPLFFGATPVLESVEPEITMRGLVEIYRRNRPA
jgi:type III pantothenate kinase